MNAAELNRAKKERAHAKETAGCPQEPCWCGLCHCTKCQEKRRFRSDISLRWSLATWFMRQIGELGQMEGPAEP